MKRVLIIGLVLGVVAAFALPMTGGAAFFSDTSLLEKRVADLEKAVATLQSQVAALQKENAAQQQQLNTLPKAGPGQQFDTGK